MNNSACSPLPNREPQAAPLPRPGNDRLRIRSTGGQAEDHYVRLNTVQIEDDSRTLCKPLSNASCICVVLGQARYIVVECVDAGSGKDPDLTHGSARHPAVADGLLYESMRSGEERAAWRAEALR